MANAQAGIQQLLQAEQDAQNVIQKARQEKILLLKRAKEEAEKEIDEYRRSREMQFKEYMSQRIGNRDEFSIKLNSQAEEQILQIKKRNRTSRTRCY